MVMTTRQALWAVFAYGLCFGLCFLALYVYRVWYGEVQ
jgi:hypothetical protein